jgi:hypothetical protein
MAIARARARLVDGCGITSRADDEHEGDARARIVAADVQRARTRQLRLASSELRLPVRIPVATTVWAEEPAFAVCIALFGDRCAREETCEGGARRFYFDPQVAIHAVLAAKADQPRSGGNRKPSSLRAV